MTIRDALKPALRSLLLRFDECAASRDALATQIAPVEAAVARLVETLAELDRQAVEVADTRLPIDAGRVASLIANTEVGQIDREEIEARALRGLQIAAQRRQGAEDLSAVQGHLRDLTARVEAARGRADDAEAAFLQSLAEAVFDAYKLDAVEFIATHVPQLHSVSAALVAKTGKPASWIGYIYHDLKIAWPSDEIVPASLSAPEHPKPVFVWPRADGALLSGKPSVSVAVVDGLIAAIRTSKG